MCVLARDEGTLCLVGASIGDCPGCPTALGAVGRQGVQHRDTTLARWHDRPKMAAGEPVPSKRGDSQRSTPASSVETRQRVAGGTAGRLTAAGGSGPAYKAAARHSTQFSGFARLITPRWLQADAQQWLPGSPKEPRSPRLTVSRGTSSVTGTRLGCPAVSDICCRRHIGHEGKIDASSMGSSQQQAAVSSSQPTPAHTDTRTAQQHK